MTNTPASSVSITLGRLQEYDANYDTVARRWIRPRTRAMNAADGTSSCSASPRIGRSIRSSGPGGLPDYRSCS